MTDRFNHDLNVGLSEEEKHDLEQMISDFQKERAANESSHDIDALHHQMETISERLASLTRMFLTIDRQIKPLFESVRLTYRKSEILNQRINTLINSIRTGEPL
jgi:hypothetical protein